MRRADIDDASPSSLFDPQLAERAGSAVSVSVSPPQDIQIYKLHI